jgi:hypothetical protein
VVAAAGAASLGVLKVQEEQQNCSSTQLNLKLAGLSSEVGLLRGEVLHIGLAQRQRRLEEEVIRRGRDRREFSEEEKRNIGELTTLGQLSGPPQNEREKLERMWTGSTENYLDQARIGQKVTQLQIDVQEACEGAEKLESWSKVLQVITATLVSIVPLLVGYLAGILGGLKRKRGTNGAY